MGEVLCSLGNVEGFTTPVGLMFSPDGQWLVAVDDAGHLTAFDTETGEPVLSWFGPVELDTETALGWLGECLVFSPDGQWVALVDQLETIGLMEIRPDRTWQLKCSLRRTDNSDGVLSASFSPDGKFLLVCWFDAGVSVWRMDETPKELWATSAAFWWGVFSADGQYVYCGGPDECVRECDAQTGQIERSFSSLMSDCVGEISNDGALSAHISADGRYLLTLPAESDSALLWDNLTGDFLQPFGVVEDLVGEQFVNVTDVRFAVGPEGEVLVLTASSMFEDSNQDESVWTQLDCWSVADQAKMGMYRLFSRDADTYDLLGDGSVAVLDERGRLKLFDLTGLGGRRLVLHGQTINFVTIPVIPGMVCRLVKNGDGSFEVSTSFLRGRKCWGKLPFDQPKGGLGQGTPLAVTTAAGGSLLVALIDPRHNREMGSDSILLIELPLLETEGR